MVRALREHNRDQNDIGAYDELVLGKRIIVYHSRDFIEDFDIPAVVQLIVNKAIRRPDIIFMSSTGYSLANNRRAEHYILISRPDKRNEDKDLFVRHIDLINMKNVEIYRFLQKDLTMYSPLRLDEDGNAPPGVIFSHRVAELNKAG